MTGRPAFSERVTHDMPTVGKVASVGVGTVALVIEGSRYPNVSVSTTLEWATITTGDLVEVKWYNKKPYVVAILSGAVSTAPSTAVPDSGGGGGGGSGGGGTTPYDHGELAGLLDDDHPQYAGITQAETISGAWTFSEDVTVDAGKTIDGVDVSDHGSRHGVGGDDAITTSSAPTIAVILATDSDAALQLKRLGIGMKPAVDNRLGIIDGGSVGQASGPLLTFDNSNDYLEITGCRVVIGGTTPDAQLHVSEGTGVPQLRLDYGGAQPADFQVDVGGDLEISATGDIVLSPAGGDVLPGSTIAYDLGDLASMWRSLFVAELYAQRLVVEDIQATLGGRLLITPSTNLAAALSGTNLIQNMSFETAGGGGTDVFADWVETAGMGSIVQDGTYTYDGSYSAKLGWGALPAFVHQDLTVSASTGYSLTFWARGDGSVAGQYRVYDNTHSGDIIALKTTGVTAATWTLVTESFDTPAGCTSIRVYCYCPGVTGYAWFDYVQVLLAELSVEHDSFSQGEYAVLMGAPSGSPQLEIIRLAEDLGGSGPYTARIDRALDGTLGNSWEEGSGLASLRAAVGEGYIDLNAGGTILGSDGPVITFNVRTGTTHWNDLAPLVAIGNLNGLVGYSSDEFGIAIGNDLDLTPPDDEFHGATLDRTNGLRLFNTPIALYNASYQTASIQADGDVFLGSDISAAATTHFAVFANAQTFDSESMGAGDVLIGDHTGANLFWDASLGEIQIRDGTTDEVVINSNGQLTWADGKGILDSAGVRLLLFEDSYWSNANSLLWYEHDSTYWDSWHGIMARIWTIGGGYVSELVLSSKWDNAPNSGSTEADFARIYLEAQTSYIEIIDGQYSGNTYKIKLQSDEITIDGDTWVYVDSPYLWASADIRVAGGISVGNASLNPEAGVIWLDEITSTPGDPTDGADVKIYMKADKLILQYNDGETVRYKYLLLSGTGALWTHTTTPP